VSSFIGVRHNSYSLLLLEQCSWGPETVKRTISRDYVQSLQRRIEGLAKYASLLETKLEKCRKDHGGMIDYLHLRPEVLPLVDEGHSIDFEPSENEDDIADQMRAFHVSRSQCNIRSKTLTAVDFAQLEGQDLHFYGRTSIFQFAPSLPRHLSRPPEVEDPSRCYVLLLDGADTSNSNIFNPNLDWCRHLPSEVYLGRPEHDKCVD
jgi:hypothetical protein